MQKLWPSRLQLEWPRFPLHFDLCYLSARKIMNSILLILSKLPFHFDISCWVFLSTLSEFDSSGRVTSIKGRLSELFDFSIVFLVAAFSSIDWQNSMVWFDKLRICSSKFPTELFKHSSLSSALKESSSLQKSIFFSYHQCSNNVSRLFCHDDAAFFIVVEKFINWDRKCQLCKNCQHGLSLKMYEMNYWKPSKKSKGRYHIIRSFEVSFEKFHYKSESTY